MAAERLSVTHTRKRLEWITDVFVNVLMKDPPIAETLALSIIKHVPGFKYEIKCEKKNELGA